MFYLCSIDLGGLNQMFDNVSVVFDTLERCLLHACSQRPPVAYLVVKCLQVKLIPPCVLACKLDFS